MRSQGDSHQGPPCIKEVAGDRPWVWQQESAPCHVSKKSLEWLEEHRVDVVPIFCTIFLCGYLEAKTDRAPNTTKDSLITAIMEQITSLSKQVVAKAYKSLRS